MHYKNIEEIIEEFNLNENLQFEDIRKELRKIQSKLHPDKNSGNFSSEEAKAKYYRINEAINFIDQNNQKSTALTVRDVTDLISSIKDLVQNKDDNSDIKLSQQIDDKIQKEKSRFFYPKITFTTVTAILTAVWLFPSTVNKHPVLKDFINVADPIFITFWVLSLIGTFFMWFYFGTIDNSIKELKKKLKIESIQNMLFALFIRYKNRPHEYYGDEKNNIILTQDEFTYFLTKYKNSPIDFRKEIRALLYDTDAFDIRIFKSIDLELAQSLTEIIFSRLEKKDIIKISSKQKSMSENYELNINPRELERFFR